MIHKSLILISAIVLFSIHSIAQEPLKYQVPPAEIVSIVDAPASPLVSVSPAKTDIVVIERPGIITIPELSAVELRSAGLRINPAINGPSRQTYNTGYKLMSIDGTNIRDIQGLQIGRASCWETV